MRRSESDSGNSLELCSGEFLMPNSLKHSVTKRKQNRFSTDVESTQSGIALRALSPEKIQIKKIGRWWGG